MHALSSARTCARPIRDWTSGPALPVPGAGSLELLDTLDLAALTWSLGAPSFGFHPQGAFASARDAARDDEGSGVIERMTGEEALVP
jgi:hypothetical protein